MAIRKYKPTTPAGGARAAPTSPRSPGIEPEKSLVRPLHSQGGRNAVRPDHHAAPGRRAQARVPADRLPPGRQGRRAREGRAHRVRPEPDRADRAAALRRRREALHHRARRPEAGRSGRERRWRRHQDRATACRCATSRPAPWCTPSSCGLAAAPRSPGPPGPACSCWRRKAGTRSSGCPRARSARSTRAAAPRSARSATPSRATSSSARPAAAGGRASGPRSAASP